MDFLFRAWKQNIRKPMKTLMIFLVMFVISNLIVTGIFILKGTEQATNATLSKITPIVYYAQDWDRYYRAQDLGFIDWETDPMPNISNEVALQISEMDYVKNYDISNEGSAMIRSIKSYKSPNNDGSNNGGGIMFDENGNQVEYYEPDYFELIGTSSSEFKVANGTIEVLDGRGITLDDIKTENAVIMLEERLAKANNLSVGDKLTIDPYVVWEEEASKIPSEFEADFEIIGIYKSLGAQDPNDTWMSERAAKQIYIPYSALNTFNYNVSVKQMQ
ncbi:MAG: ABC transporter permease, partial [Turicibacter sp.]